MNWQEYFIGFAELAKMKSKDRSTKVGVVIVGEGHNLLSIGFNGFPRGVDDEVDARHDRPAKYAWTEHAERNAIFNAARYGIKTAGTTMFFNSNPYPCTDCTRAVIQAGIRMVVGRDMPFCAKKPAGEDWLKSCAIGREMLMEAGVRVMLLNDDYSPKFVEGAWSPEEVDTILRGGRVGNTNYLKNGAVQYPADVKLKCFYEE